MRHADKGLLPNGTTLAHALRKYAKLMPSESCKVWIGVNAVANRRWRSASAAKRKVVGWKFSSFVETLFRPVLPTHDRWHGVMTTTDITTSPCVRNLANGLNWKLAARRRCVRSSLEAWPPAISPAEFCPPSATRAAAPSDSGAARKIETEAASASEDATPVKLLTPPPSATARSPSNKG